MMGVGHLNDQKKVQTISNAMSMRPKNCQGLIRGTGPLEQNLRALAIQMNVEGRCHFLGFRSDVKTLLMISDLLLMVQSQSAKGTANMRLVVVNATT